MTEAAGTKRAVKKGRSPSYPGIPLETAIERARLVWDKEKGHPAPPEAVLGHWGYSVKSSNGLITLAALKKFGLLEDEGVGSDRSVRLSGLAQDIILSPNPGESIRRSALTPSIHRELWEQYRGELPSDANLRYELIRKRSFTEAGAEEFIRQFRKTVSFAGLSPSDAVVPEDGEAASEEPEEGSSSWLPGPARLRPSPTFYGGGRPASSTQGAGRGPMVIPIPLPGSTTPIEIVGRFPVSDTDWAHFVHVLDALKPGLVVNRLDDDDLFVGDEEHEDAEGAF